MTAKPHDELTLARLEPVILHLAQCVVAHGPRFAPFLDKLLAERDRLAGLQDPVAKAQAIIARAGRSAAIPAARQRS